MKWPNKQSQEFKQEQSCEGEGAVLYSERILTSIHDDSYRTYWQHPAAR
jgi:hypothetical protein